MVREPEDAPVTCPSRVRPQPCVATFLSITRPFSVSPPKDFGP